jgi:hypothetical protein
MVRMDTGATLDRRHLVTYVRWAEQGDRRRTERMPARLLPLNLRSAPATHCSMNGPTQRPPTVMATWEVLALGFRLPESPRRPFNYVLGDEGLAQVRAWGDRERVLLLDPARELVDCLHRAPDACGAAIEWQQVNAGIHLSL